MQEQNQISKLKPVPFKPKIGTKYYVDNAGSLIACEQGNDEYDTPHCFELKIIAGQLQAFPASNDVSKLRELPTVRLTGGD